MRLPTAKEKEVYKEVTGKEAPVCVVQKAPFFPGWNGLTLWRLVLVRDYARSDVVVHEMVHVEKFKWLVGSFK